MKKWIVGLFLCAALGAQAAPPLRGESEPNPEKLREMRARRYQIAHPETEGRLERQALDLDAGEQGRVLVLLVEFGGTNTFTWTPGESLWDPFGYADRGEWNGTNHSDAVASQFFADYYGITGPTNMVYSGPLHNEIPRPPSGDTDDPLWSSIWRPDFSADYYSDIISGNGAVFDFERGDGSHYYADWSGYSVSNYYAEMSGGKYALDGDVYGWITLTNSLMYYAADSVPGALSVSGDVKSQVEHHGGVIGTSGSDDLAVNACRAAMVKYPEINWKDYDLDGDGVIDSLWIIFAGFGESGGKSYDNSYMPEARMWPHSDHVSSSVEIKDGIRVKSYIMIPESSGPAVLAHEYGHALGAIDLYSYAGGRVSAESWTQMGYDWIGFPTGYFPLAMDPYHLDSWGWLEPLSLTNPPTEPMLVELYQAGSGLNVPEGMERSVRVRLEDQRLEVLGNGSYWWSGAESSSCKVLAPTNTFLISGSDAEVSIQMAYDVEPNNDRLVLAMLIGPDGQHWSTNEVIYTGRNSGYPEYQTKTFQLGDYAGLYARFMLYYETDEAVEAAGAFVGEILFNPGGEEAIRQWSADDPQEMQSDWLVEDGVRTGIVPHYYYLQWRNTEADGGYDQILGHASSDVGQATSGLLVWYVNERYEDNEMPMYLTDLPSYGAKGVAQVVDAHPGVFARRTEYGGRSSTNALVMYNNLSLGRDAAFGLRETFALPDGTNGVQAGRAVFTDSRNYSAGAAYTYLYPRSVPPQFEWSAWSYDGSVVTPSKEEYSLRAPGMPADTEVYRVWRDGGYTHASESVSLPGGTGNPLDVGGEYGWNFEVVEDRGTSAVVRIWNSHVCAPYPVLVDCFGEGSTWPSDDFLAWPESNAVVQVEAAPYHHISQLLYNGAEVADAVGLQNYSLDLGTVNSNSAVYAFFGANRVPGSDIPQKWFADQGIPLKEDVLSADFDGDGLSNAAEYAAGTRAADASSGLALSIAPSADGVGLSWASEWNHWYELDVSTNLLTDPFRRIEGPLPGEYDWMDYPLPDSAAESGFYRIRVVPSSEE